MFEILHYELVNIEILSPYFTLMVIIFLILCSIFIFHLMIKFIGMIFFMENDHFNEFFIFIFLFILKKFYWINLILIPSPFKLYDYFPFSFSFIFDVIFITFKFSFISNSIDFLVFSLANSTQIAQIYFLYQLLLIFELNFKILWKILNLYLTIVNPLNSLDFLLLRQYLS